MSKHTPGPWHQNKRPDSSIEIWGEGPVCTVCYYADERFEANSNLIEAAPKLLQACEQFFAATDREHKHRAMVAMEEAVLEAKGGTKNE